LEEKINAMAGDPHDLRNIFLQMYAKPLQNKQAMSGV
jgi:hypothetical protein